MKRTLFALCSITLFISPAMASSNSGTTSVPNSSIGTDINSNPNPNSQPGSGTINQDLSPAPENTNPGSSNNPGTDISPNDDNPSSNSTSPSSNPNSSY